MEHRGPGDDGGRVKPDDGAAPDGVPDMETVKEILRDGDSPHVGDDPAGGIENICYGMFTCFPRPSVGRASTGAPHSWSSHTTHSHDRDSDWCLYFIFLVIKTQTKQRYLVYVQFKNLTMSNTAIKAGLLSMFGKFVNQLIHVFSDVEFEFFASCCCLRLNQEFKYSPSYLYYKITVF